VFDDADGAAPPGGYIGWNVGTVSTTGGGIWSRTPGRLSPFNFAQAPTSNGSPVADPFTDLTVIDNTLGIQTVPWGCDAAGQPLPPPPPVVRGRNMFVSTYEMTVETPNAPSTMDVTLGGRRFAVAEWRFDLGLSTLPDCNTGVAGAAFYYPIVTSSSPPPFTQAIRIQVVVPSPGAGLAVLALGCGGLIRRRR
jgi:hypothetical protein